LGLTNQKPAKFVRQYANLAPIITEAIAEYANDVRKGEFPGPDEVYANPEDLVN
jgi:3-methyl-2-oxobutanoate hydroxymethyltransferase